MTQSTWTEYPPTHCIINPKIPFSYKHFHDCIHCANQLLVKLLKQKNDVNAMQLHLSSDHRYIRQRFIFQNRRWFIKTFLNITSPSFRIFNHWFLRYCCPLNIGKKQLKWMHSPKINNRMNEMNEFVQSINDVGARKIDQSALDALRAGLPASDDGVQKIAKYLYVVDIDVACGNIRCKNRCLQVKYGEFTNFRKSHISNLNKPTAVVLKAVYLYDTKIMNKKVINKWYICKGCKTTSYCSKTCQKINWSRQNHKYQCQMIQKCSFRK